MDNDVVVLVDGVPVEVYQEKLKNDKKEKEIERERKNSENVTLKRQIVKGNVVSKYSHGDVTKISKEKIMEYNLKTAIEFYTKKGKRVKQCIIGYLLLTKGKKFSNQDIKKYLEEMNITFKNNFAVSNSLRNILRSDLNIFFKKTDTNNGYYQYIFDGDFETIEEVMKYKKPLMEDTCDLSCDSDEIINPHQNPNESNDHENQNLDKSNDNNLSISQIIEKCIVEGISFEIKIGSRIKE